MHSGPVVDVASWATAATGPGGFWTRARPGAHFRTAAATGPELGAALARLLTDHPGVGRAVDVGAGDGRLLAELHELRPDLALTGVDLRPRPPGLPGAVTWRVDRWDVVRGRWDAGGPSEPDGPALLVAAEWLDDLPCPVRRRGDLAAEERAWAARWWPEGPVVEVGRTRDAAWAALVRALRPRGGLLLAVDYGHRRADRPRSPTLAAYRDGRPVAAVAHPDRNLTAHVAVDAVRAAGEQAGARTLLLARQAEALPALLPPLPREPLAALAARSRRAALTDPRGWGGHWWLLQEVPPDPARPAPS